MRRAALLVGVLTAAAPIGAQGVCDASVAIALRAEAGSVRSAIAALATILQPAHIPAWLDSVAHRLDSTATACVAREVTDVSIGFDFTSTTLWPAGQIGSFPGGNERQTLCAAVNVSGVLHLGDRAVIATYLPSGQGRDFDSVAFVLRPETPTTGLRPLCGAHWPDPPNYNVRVPTIPVTWSSVRVRPVPGGIPVATPIATPTLPP